MMDRSEILDIPLPDDNAFTIFILHYKQLMALYESAIRCVAMRLDIMETVVVVITIFKKFLPAWFLPPAS
ncbi:MAG: hypothetical protein HFF90_03770 [Oscillibacter sp.]|nr:hypothetical protein [Oscillibacter sp.]